MKQTAEIVGYITIALSAVAFVSFLVLLIKLELSEDEGDII